jgi:hypothetical protein
MHQRHIRFIRASFSSELTMTMRETCERRREVRVNVGRSGCRIGVVYPQRRLRISAAAVQRSP